MVAIFSKNRISATIAAEEADATDSAVPVTPSVSGMSVKLATALIYFPASDDVVV